tara:strand:+ start:7802 stop:10261 length:2460 start_codon:yes stop_codon:yes gene_type:complete
MAIYRSSQGFTDSQDNQKSFNERFIDSDPGPYIATVKVVVDPQRMGRLGVNIPSLTNTTDPSPNQITWCQYLSPFYGAKSIKSVSKTDPYNYKETQHAYGMWAVPPDIDTEVLVIFAKGEKAQGTAFWIGCVQQPFVNQSIPAHGATTNTRVGADGTDFSQNKQELYGTDQVPAGEKNMLMYQDGETGKNVDAWKYPVNDILSEQLQKQGLVQDNVRGTTTSSARRESPSRVFGMSTPGAVRADSRTLNIGVGNTPVRPDRNPGHSFVMDDGATDGSNQMTRLRTSSGHQLLMHDTQGVIYIANASGNAWIEMNKDGKIDIYSGVGGINMRTQGDFNLHSDANINMHAAGSIRMSAETDMVQSASAMFNLGEKGIFNSSQAGSIRDFARDGLTSFTPGTQLHGAGGQIHLAGAQVHMNSTGASPTWGPGWLTTDKVGMTPRDEGDVELAGKPLGQILQSFTKKTKTTVHRFVTHEPMPRFQSFTSEGHLPSSDPLGDRLDTKQWYRLSSTPGTVEYMEQKNRISSIESIRLGQFQADAERYLKDKMGTSTSATKARELVTNFGNKYDKSFNIINQSKGKFKEIESISNKLQNINLSDSISSVKNNLTKQLSNQVIESISGNGAVQLFKDNVFANAAGQLYSLKGGGADLGKVLSSVQGITGNLDIGNIGSIANNVSTVTNVYKNVLAGNITNVSQVSSIVNRAKGFFSAGQGGGPGRYNPSGFSSLVTSVGSYAKTAVTAISGFFSGGGFFSDVRLKEDIKLVGKSPSGINIYSFKYKQLDGTFEGVMAQEVPWAREMTDTGFYMVDYSKVDVEFRRLN